MNKIFNRFCTMLSCANIERSFNRCIIGSCSEDVVYYFSWDDNIIDDILIFHILDEVKQRVKEFI
jgi:hypothetical protein